MGLSNSCRHAHLFRIGRDNKHPGFQESGWTKEELPRRRSLPYAICFRRQEEKNGQNFCFKEFLFTELSHF